MTREKPKNFNGAKKEMGEGDRKKILENFRKFAVYRNDLPPKKLEPGDKDYYLFKCRNNFWAVISFQIQFLLEKKIIADLDAVEQCENFVKYSIENAGRKKFTTKEEIDYINKIINLVIEQLEKPEDKED